MLAQRAGRVEAGRSPLLSNKPHFRIRKLFAGTCEICLHGLRSCCADRFFLVLVSPPLLKSFGVVGRRYFKMRGKRSKQYRKLMEQFSMTFGFREPYQILGLSLQMSGDVYESAN